MLVLKIDHCVWCLSFYYILVFDYRNSLEFYPNIGRTPNVTKKWKTCSSLFLEMFRILLIVNIVNKYTINIYVKYKNTRPKSFSRWIGWMYFWHVFYSFEVYLFPVSWLFIPHGYNILPVWTTSGMSHWYEWIRLITNCTRGQMLLNWFFWHAIYTYIDCIDVIALYTRRY